MPLPDGTGPIQWRTGVPTTSDIIVAERLGTRFALRLDDGSVLRKVEMRVLPGWVFGGWEWAANDVDFYISVIGWCPEYEMPEGGA